MNQRHPTVPGYQRKIYRSLLKILIFLDETTLKEFEKKLNPCCDESRKSVNFLTKYVENGRPTSEEM